MNDYIELGKVVKIINTEDPTKFYLRKVKEGKIFEDHQRSFIYSKDIVGKKYGFSIGKYFLAKPSVEDFILYYWKRKTQIVYPKDSSYILSKMSINYNSVVLEIGTGSGVMSLLLAKQLFPNGKLISIDKNFSYIKNAINNIMDFDQTFSTNYLKVISFFLSDNLNFLKVKFSNVFVDVPNLKVDDLLAILETGSALVLVFPTVNQIIDFLNKTREYLIDVSIEEVIVRKYKVNPARIRPNDTMVAHTAYILSAKIKGVSREVSFNSEVNL